MKLEFRQPIADIVLKYNEFGSTLQLKHITPAELMFLVAMHHRAAGGDPVVKLKEIPADIEEKQIETLSKEVAEFQKKLDALGAEANITEEVRERREASFQSRIASLESRIQDLRSIQFIRLCAPSDERSRLCGRYSQLELEKFYPGAIPQLPQSFDEARRAGTGVKTSSEAWLVNGDKVPRAA